ncbi:oxygenase MpaB family protein [Cellulomonas aerilata]|uniref:ER-bound oxygenase mpaB/mpaB'/Rubber oxygenase catalytic domain-containing protein n=1 Tax=Cellulomonas aerilata TaxID=515326 RepID=A0A512DG55_9CELL|nr:oxygenase MpaB family protein [Cellulomonas aerilata]GEO35473.1 hypothetical protein CAE01nite_31980 [Cellulomonas aerilata]
MLPLSTFFPPAPEPGRAGDPGTFGPGSAAWRLARERVVLVGGPAALLLQVAHPLVAAGVAAHSDFAADPLRRLQGTLDAVMTVTFGDTAQVRGAARHVAHRHRPVRGTLPVATGGHPAGTPYSAADPDLALWVFATLVWTSVQVVDGFVRPVRPPEREAYYRDMTQVAPLFGIPARVLPADYADLARYVDAQVDGVLAVGDAAARLADQILAPDPPILPAPARGLPALLAAGVLPPALRAAYGLDQRRRDRFAFGAAQQVSRRVLPLLPSRARYWPHYVIATQRVTAEQVGPERAGAERAGAERVGAERVGTEPSA